MRVPRSACVTVARGRAADPAAVALPAIGAPIVRPVIRGGPAGVAHPDLSEVVVADALSARCRDAERDERENPEQTGAHSPISLNGSRL